MDKEITKVRVGNSTMMCVTVLVPLSTSQVEKMESRLLVDRIANLAKDFHVDWSIRVNNHDKTAEIAHNHRENVITSQMLHDDEVNAINFMSAIDKMEMEEQDPEEDEFDECIILNEDIPAIRKFIKNVMDDEDIIGAGLAVLSLPGNMSVNCGHISKPILNQMCQAWLDTHKEA